MSDTPRTDALNEALALRLPYRCKRDLDAVWEFACQLEIELAKCERELAALRHNCDYWREMAEHLGGLEAAAHKHETKHEK